MRFFFTDLYYMYVKINGVISFYSTLVQKTHQALTNMTIVQSKKAPDGPHLCVHVATKRNVATCDVAVAGG